MQRQAHATGLSCCCCVAHRLTSRSRCILGELDVLHPAGLILRQERVQLRAAPVLLCRLTCRATTGPPLRMHTQRLSQPLQLNAYGEVIFSNSKEAMLLRKYAITLK